MWLDMWRLGDGSGKMSPDVSEISILMVVGHWFLKETCGW